MHGLLGVELPLEEKQSASREPKSLILYESLSQSALETYAKLVRLKVEKAEVKEKLIY